MDLPDEGDADTLFFSIKKVMSPKECARIIQHLVEVGISAALYNKSYEPENPDSDWCIIDRRRLSFLRRS